MTRKNILLYLNRLIQAVYNNKIGVQEACFAVFELPFKLNDAYIVPILQFAEDHSGFVCSRQRFIKNHHKQIKKAPHHYNKKIASEIIDSLRSELQTASHNLAPFVSDEGKNVSKNDFKMFVWDICLSINNPDNADFDYQGTNSLIHTDEPTDHADSDEVWLRKITKARKSQDEHWGRINHLTDRV